MTRPGRLWALRTREIGAGRQKAQGNPIGEVHQWARAHFYFEVVTTLAERRSLFRPRRCFAQHGAQHRLTRCLRAMHDLSNIEAIARRVAESSGLELVEVEMRGAGGKGRTLRVVIDRPGAQPGAAVPHEQAGPHEQAVMRLARPLGCDVRARLLHPDFCSRPKS